MRQAILGVILGCAVTTAAALIIRVETGPPPVWSVAQAEAKQRELNAERRAGECGRWMVSAHPGGEGRLRYDLGGCPATYPLRVYPRFIQERNETLDTSQNFRDMYREIESVGTVVAEIASSSSQEVRRRTAGTDAAITKMFKSLER